MRELLSRLSKRRSLADVHSNKRTHKSSSAAANKNTALQLSYCIPLAMMHQKQGLLPGYVEQI